MILYSLNTSLRKGITRKDLLRDSDLPDEPVQNTGRPIHIKINCFNWVEDLMYHFRAGVPKVFTIDLNHCYISFGAYMGKSNLKEFCHPLLPCIMPCFVTSVYS